MEGLLPRLSTRGGGGPLARRKDHKRQRRSKAPPWKKWYYTARWRKLRLKIFARDGFVCAGTGIICTGKGQEPDAPICDHKRPHRGDPKLFWDETNLQTVCHAYHVKEKQRLEALGDLDPS